MFSFLVILSASLITQCIASDNSPVISFGEWSSTDNHNWETNETAPFLFADEGNQSIAVPGYVNGFTLMCNASFPIEWAFHQDKWGYKERWTVSLTTRRFATDIYNLSSFKYSAQLRFQGDSNALTGNYTCQNVQNQRESASLYVFWEGSSPPYLVRSGESLTVVYNKKSEIFTIPCRVSVPTVEVKLLKEYTYAQSTSMVPLLLNSSIAYENTKGFILKGLANPYGRYKCVVDKENDKDYVDSQVVPDNDGPKPEFNDTILRNSTFKYDTKAQNFVCCSSNARAPKLMHYYCNHPTTCKLKIEMLHNIESSSSRRVNGSCSLLSLRTKNAGVFRCLGDGIDIMREYFFPIGQGLFTRRRQWKNHLELNASINEKPFFSWNEAVPEKMLSITTRTEGVIYAGQNVTFDCQVSSYYFSVGIKWGVSWSGTNSSFVVLNGDTFNYGNKMFRLWNKRNRAFIKIIADASITSVVCIAPVWNSTEWKNTTLQLYIKVPHSPTILGGDAPEEIYWYLNDTLQSLQCSAEGIPTPSIYWRKDNGTLRFDAVKYGNGTSTVNISRVSYETHGVYVCYVKNLAGTVRKEFHVFVHERMAGSVITIIVLFVLAGIAAVIGIAVAVIKMKVQKQTIKYLTHVAFRDVVRVEGPENPEVPVGPKVPEVAAGQGQSTEPEPVTKGPSTTRVIKVEVATTSNDGGNVRNAIIFQGPTN